MNKLIALLLFASSPVLAAECPGVDKISPSDAATLTAPQLQTRYCQAKAKQEAYTSEMYGMQVMDPRRNASREKVDACSDVASNIKQAAEEKGKAITDPTCGGKVTP